jgi:hypothetical protein
VRQACDLAILGAIGAVFGLYLYVELVQARSVYVRDALAGLAIGGSIGFFLSAYGPYRDGSWRKLSHSVARGTVLSALGGSAGLVLGELVIGLFQGGLLGRAVSWAVLGLGIGLGQGIAEGSRPRIVNGLLGGGLGGLAGGYLFESLRLLLGNRYDLSQSLGIVLLGAGLGLFLALVEQALRRAWLQFLNGRQEGRIVLLARPTSRIGLDEQAEVGIFGDAGVARRHAEIEATPSGFLFRPLDSDKPSRINGTAVSGTQTLRDGDRIELGRTLLVFRQR